MNFLTNNVLKGYTMNKTTAIAQFKDENKAEITNFSKGDFAALRELWNNYTDMLCRNGDITTKQYETWHHPKFISNPAKTYLEYQVHQNCGYGWEEVCYEETRKEAKQRLTEYPGWFSRYSVKIVVKRVKIGG